jgi:hypothetical protein
MPLSKPSKPLPPTKIIFLSVGLFLSGMIQYRFILESGRVFQFPVDMDRWFDPNSGAAAHAEWTRLAFNQCENCPLNQNTRHHCPVAVDIEQIAFRFKDILSYEQARVEVTVPERMYVKDCDVQTGLRSLLGLIMATSSCPTLAQFRGLAAVHLPFATLEETLFRAAGAYLLKQYYLGKNGGVPDVEMRGLERIYQELQIINRCFKRRLDTAFENEANLNAIGSLLYVAVGVSFSLEDNLVELKAAFHP